MSDTKKTVKTKSDVKKVAAAHRGLTELQVKKICSGLIKEFHKDDKPPLTEEQVYSLIEDAIKKIVQDHTPTGHRVFLCNVRWDHPHFGGFPMPPGVCFYGFKTFRLTEIEPGEGLTEAQILQKAIEEGAGQTGLVVESITLLPEKY